MVGSVITRDLSLDLARVTEAAAIAVAPWIGRDQKDRADEAAVEAMRRTFETLEMEGEVVIGEGEKDHAPMLFTGEVLGAASQPKVDIAVDPIDGTRLVALGMPGAVAVLGIAGRGCVYRWQGIAYMEMIAVGPAARGAISLLDPVADNLQRIAEAKSRPVSDLTVVISDRPRHVDLIRQIRASGARVSLVLDGDVAGALLAALDGTGIDALMGIGGSPEAVIAACALKCLGGDIQCRLWPRNDEERSLARELGIELERVWGLDDLVRGEDACFAATGITDGPLLKGIHRAANGSFTTDSLVLRAPAGAIRHVQTVHNVTR